jgi:hypothetical protein
VTEFTAGDKLKCVLREWNLRFRVYPRLVERGRMRDHEATRELALMTAIIEDYRALAEKERLL